MLATTLSLILPLLSSTHRRKRAGRRKERGASGATFPAGEVVVTLNEETFNALLNAMLSGGKPLTFPLTRGARRGQGGEPGASGATARASHVTAGERRGADGGCVP